MKNHLAGLTLLALCLGSFARAIPAETKAEGVEEGQPNALGLYLYQVESPYCFHTVLQEQFLQDGNRNPGKFAKGTAAIDKPESLKIEWEARNKSGSAKPTYTLSVSENEDLSDAWTYTTKEEFAYVTNFKLATRYFYQVSTNFGGSISYSQVKHFSTENGMVRNLNIDGVMNFRDLGGWRNSEAKFMVKQGMIFRSGPFNSSYAPNAIITSAGRAEIKKLGIRTEIDLRLSSTKENGGISSSVLSGVNYVSAPIDYSIPMSVLSNAKNAESLKKIFHVLADESNYPVDFHCTVGTDRTGLVAFLINGLLGVSEADLFRDYLFSNFANVSYLRKRSTIENAYVGVIKNASGSTLQDKIVHTLTGIGVDIHDLSSLYYLMQEEGYRL